MAEQFTPNMDKLKAELGRVPPEPTNISRPEDFAPKSKPDNRAPYISQALKVVMHSGPRWLQLSVGEQEALDLIATRISYILTSPGDQFWENIATLAEGALD